KLSKAQQEALLKAQTGREVLWVLNGVFGAAALVWALGSGVAVAEGGNGWDEVLMFAAMGFLPFGIVVAGAVVGGRRLTARRQALAELCTASPPVAAGAPVRCRVCAAPVEPKSDSPIVSCGYCEADNIVSREALGRATVRQVKATENLVGEVQAALTDVGAAARAAWISALKTAFAAPALGLAASFLVVLVTNAVPLEVDRKVQYAVVDEGGRPCIGRIVDGDLLETRRDEEALAVTRTRLAGGAAKERGDATLVLGRRLKDTRGKVWTVRDVKRKLAGRNYVEFKEDDAPAWTELEAFCLAE
ncbi:MAG: hypothetical protein ACK4N5_27330, partial [Myxococcales bacterium]